MDKLAFIFHMLGMSMVIGSGFTVLALKMGSSDMNKSEREPYIPKVFGKLVKSSWKRIKFR